ncbi:MAG: hypothetical protein WCF64_01900 [Methylocella sp.]
MRFALWNLWLIPLAPESRGTPARIWAARPAGHLGEACRNGRRRATCPAPSELVEDCPERGTGAALVMPAAGIEAVNKHLPEISPCVSVRAIAPPILDGAGWRGSPQLAVPETIVPMPLPPSAPEPNSVDPSPGSGHMGRSARRLSQPLRPGHP